MGDQRVIGDVQAHGPRVVGTEAVLFQKELFQNEMRTALELASLAGEAGEIPVGAVVLDESGSIIAQGSNTREHSHDPTGHAEIVALRAAAQIRGSWNLSGCTLVVTLEPCIMCAGAILQAHVSRVVFGAWDDKAGAAGSRYDLLRDRRLPTRAEVHGGVCESESQALLSAFFETRRSGAD